MQVLKTKKTTDLNLRQAVSQSAKTPIFLLKTNNNKALEVGRQQNENPHTSAHTHTGDFKEKSLENSADFTAMKYLNKLLADLLPDLKVCFHNPLYVQQIEESYPKNESSIFLQFVKTFAQFRHTERTEPLENVILTNENDFLTAFKLMQQRKIEEYSSVKAKNKNKVFDLLTIKFQHRTFSTQLLAKELFYNYKLLHKIITLLLLEHKIEFVKELKGQLFYRLREKSKVYVVGA